MKFSTLACVGAVVNGKLKNLKYRFLKWENIFTMNFSTKFTVGQLDTMV